MAALALMECLHTVVTVEHAIQAATAKQVSLLTASGAVDLEMYSVPGV